MSMRNFERVFTGGLGVSPGAVRFANACRSGTTNDGAKWEGMQAIAVWCGFSSADVMRRAFERTVGKARLKRRGRRFMAKEIRQRR